MKGVFDSSGPSKIKKIKIKMRGALLAQFGLAHFEMENKVQSAVESEPLSALERAFPWSNREMKLSRIKSIISHFHIQYKFKRKSKIRIYCDTIHMATLAIVL